MSTNQSSSFNLLRSNCCSSCKQMCVNSLYHASECFVLKMYALSSAMIVGTRVIMITDDLLKVFYNVL
jgi:hypothetical protein